MSTGNYDLQINWPGGRHSSAGTITDEQWEAIARVLSPDWQASAAHDVLAERSRQITAEGWTPEHDDEHDPGELARAAAAYLLSAFPRSLADCGFAGRLWPWDNGLKPKSKREDMVRGTALALAAIERIDRAPAGIDSEGGSHD